MATARLNRPRLLRWTALDLPARRCSRQFTATESSTCVAGRNRGRRRYLHGQWRRHVPDPSRMATEPFLRLNRCLWRSVKVESLRISTPTGKSISCSGSVILLNKSKRDTAGAGADKHVAHLVAESFHRGCKRHVYGDGHIHDCGHNHWHGQFPGRRHADRHRHRRRGRRCDLRHNGAGARLALDHRAVLRRYELQRRHLHCHHASGERSRR